MSRISAFLIDIFRDQRGMAFSVVSILIGLLAIILYASQASKWGQFISIVGVAIMIACASLLSGGLVGFLFGIPRTLQGDQAEPATPDTQAEDTSQEKRPHTPYQTNTNLEQISDWLTKILTVTGFAGNSGAAGKGEMFDVVVLAVNVAGNFRIDEYISEAQDSNAWHGLSAY